MLLLFLPCTHTHTEILPPQFCVVKIAHCCIVYIFKKRERKKGKDEKGRIERRKKKKRKSRRQLQRSRSLLSLLSLFFFFFFSFFFRYSLKLHRHKTKEKVSLSPFTLRPSASLLCCSAPLGLLKEETGQRVGWGGKGERKIPTCPRERREEGGGT